MLLINIIRKISYRKPSHFNIYLKNNLISTSSRYSQKSLLVKKIVIVDILQTNKNVILL